MKEIIKLAIGGGYKPRGIEIESWSSFDSMISLVPKEEHWSDPKFWQALGKAMGWNKLAPYELVNKNIPEWHYHWHKFIDHLAEGGDPTSFFNQL